MNLLPYLKITYPDGEEQILKLTKTIYTIGRLPEHNDIDLPETEGIITRIEHCILERKTDGWWIKDKSTNGTIIERAGVQLQIKNFPEQKILIYSEDIIKIHNYELKFIDPAKTPNLSFKDQVNLISNPPILIFNLSQLTLYKVEQYQRISIPLTPQLIDMLTCLARKNLANNNQPTVCTYDELITAIWKGDNFGDKRSLINGLAKDIRKIFTENGGDSSLLDTRKTKGYLLKISCEL